MYVYIHNRFKRCLCFAISFVALVSHILLMILKYDCVIYPQQD